VGNILATAAVLKTSFTARADEPQFAFEEGADRLKITLGGRPLATYVFCDKVIRRPYFQDVFTPGGMRVTRPNPPDPAKEATDHVTMHPGLWLAFGSLNGMDYWRNKAEVRHVGFAKPPIVEDHVLSFETDHEYLDEEGTTVLCRERAAFAFRKLGPDIVFDWTSAFRSDDSPLYFGSQEEMGLGLRLTRPMTVKYGGGRINDSRGGIDEKGTWGQTATWWAATVSAPTLRRSGIEILASSSRTSLKYWGHTRDYGLIVANPSPQPDSGRGAIGYPTEKPLELRFRIRLFDAADNDLAAWAIRNARN
jgi:hypothetical protein